MSSLSGYDTMELIRELLKRYDGFQGGTRPVILLTEHPTLGVGFGVQQVSDEIVLDEELGAYGIAGRILGESLDFKTGGSRG